MFFRFPHIDSFSFWVGIVVASIAWWIIRLLRPVFQQIRANARAKREKVKSRTTSLVEDHYRKMVLQKAQGSHLAAPLFSLDEIVISPKLLAPPVRVEPGILTEDDDIVSLTLPHLPAWPDMASIYRAPTITLSEALSGDSDIVLTGHAGTGKTVTLAYLASRLARREPVVGLAEETLPIFVHVADLNLPIEEDVLTPLIELISENSSIFDLPRIPDFIRRAFLNGRVLLLVDGTDELTPKGFEEVIEFIKAIKRDYSKTRLVTTANPEYLDGLVTLNFTPFTLSTWDHDQRTEFLDKWAHVWTHYVSVEAWAQTGPEQIDTIILNNWLKADSALLTPLEFTLKTWGLYSGDLRGPRTVDYIESHIRRLTPSGAPPAALELLALQVTLAMEPVFDPRKAREWIKDFEPVETTTTEGEGERASHEKEASPKKVGKQDKPPIPSTSFIAKMANSGLLTQHRNNRMRFLNPVLGGFLAGRAMVNYKAETVLNQPYCLGKILSLHYLAVSGDVALLSEKLLGEQDRPLQRNLFTVAHWLNDAPRNATWRGPVMSHLVNILQNEGQPLGLRGQALAAIIRSNDPSTAVLLRQLCEVDSPELLQLCTLGIGALQDVKAVTILGGLLAYQSQNVRRGACLALVAIGTTSALEAVASALLHGDETTRRSAAEALANNPDEGFAMLKDAASMEDILVRRAAVYGLGRIHEPWADEMITRMQIEDSEWIIRNAATEMLEKKQRITPHIPKRLPHPSESPWLIEYAGKQGLGVSPDKPATGLLLNALKSGSEEEQLAALSYLRMMPAEGVFGALYQAMYGGNRELREAVFQTIWEMATTGVDIPDPQQFGVG